ncbi:hypothetical protein CBS470a_004272 [Colletotrichum nupharicola]|nr:hypothetical protein CBS470a_004272 [Colletotrichum nupharicola]
MFNLLLLIAFVGGTVGSCQPIHYFWDGWTGEMKGQCINLNAFAMCHGALNVALDVWMLVLPATQVYDLRMPLMRKLGVMLMFGPTPSKVHFGHTLNYVWASSLPVYRVLAKSGESSSPR